MKKGISIAIDGPLASGKGTLANALADRLGGFFMNTGGMYRALALFCIEQKIDLLDESEVSKILTEVNVEFMDKRLILNGRDITERVRDSDVTNGSSVVAVYKEVRDYFVPKQQKIANDLAASGQTVIAEGRDTGTKVFPNAALKIFLTAGLEIRAKRSLERYEKKEIGKTLDEAINETKIRDERDRTREIDPLPSDPQAFGYWVLDNSNQTEEESVDTILNEIRKRGLIT